MIIFTSIIAFLVLPVLGGLLEYNPVEVTELKNIIIKNFKGDFYSQTLTLHRNVERLRIINSSVLAALDLCTLPNLNSLTMEKNDLRDLYLNLVCFGQELEHIVMWKNDYPDHKAWLRKFGQLGSLISLCLSHQNFRILENDCLYNENLEKLCIVSSSLTIIENQAFSNLPQLDILMLKDNRISWINKEVFAPLINLRYINLSGNEFTRLAADMFPSLPNLKELKFDYNNLTVINLNGIEEVAPALRYIYIDGFSNDSFQCSKSMKCVFSEKKVTYKISLEKQMTEPTI